MDNPNQMFHGETTEPERQILLPLTPHEYQFMVDCVGLYVAITRTDELLCIAINNKIQNSYVGDSTEKINALFEKLNKITHATVDPSDIIPI